MNQGNPSGRYLVKSGAGESYRVFIPADLPPVLNLEGLYPKLEAATRAIGELSGAAQTIPNASLFLYMYVRKEALLSSQIEGTQSSLSDLMLFENNQKPSVSVADVEEVSNYVVAIQHGIKRLREGFPLSLRLLREVHGILLQGGRGVEKLPGEFRRSQNWIGGTRPGNARFVPPSPEHLMECLGALETFLHDQRLPVLVRAGLAHVQFETIHPFLDGNGRLGRLLITLLLYQGGLLTEPILYLSLYLKQHRATYYRLLDEVRMHGAWEAWLEFFLDGVSQTAQQAIATTKQLNKLFVDDAEKIATLGRAKVSCIKVFDYLKRLPQVTVPVVAEALKLSAPTTRAALQNLQELGVVTEVGGKQRGKVYVYKQYLNILEAGTEPL